MKVATCVSIDLEDKEFLSDRGLSASRILRRAINEVRDGKDSEELIKKIKKLQDLFEKARDFIEISGLRQRWESHYLDICRKK